MRIVQKDSRQRLEVKCRQNDRNCTSKRPAFSDESKKEQGRKYRRRNVAGRKGQEEKGRKATIRLDETSIVVGVIANNRNFLSTFFY